MPTTHTAQYFNARHHQPGTKLTDAFGDTWTRANTHWHCGDLYTTHLPRDYEPYTHKPTRAQSLHDELAKNAALFLAHERAFYDQPRRSQCLFQTIPSTWTKPTNLLPKANWEERYKNWEDIYNHYKNLGQTNPQPLTKNIHLPHATPQNDPINPNHYKGFSNNSEVIDITENLTFNTGNATKYLTRAGRTDGHNKGE